MGRHSERDADTSTSAPAPLPNSAPFNNGASRSTVGVSCIQYTIGGSIQSGPVRTGCLHEGPVEAEGEKRLLEAPQEVLEETGDGVDVVHLAEHGDSFAPQELFLQLLDGAIRTRQTVQSSLTKQRTQQFSTLCSGLNPRQMKSDWETAPPLNHRPRWRVAKIGNRTRRRVKQTQNCAETHWAN